MIRKIMIAAASAAVLALSPTTFAQQPSQYGKADEARAMLLSSPREKVGSWIETSMYFATMSPTARSLPSATLMQRHFLARTPGPLRTPPARSLAWNSLLRGRSRKVKSPRSATCL